MYSVQCTVYSIQCTVYSVQCTVYSMHIFKSYGEAEGKVIGIEMEETFFVKVKGVKMR